MLSDVSEMQLQTGLPQAGEITESTSNKLLQFSKEDMIGNNIYETLHVSENYIGKCYLMQIVCAC